MRYDLFPFTGIWIKAMKIIEVLISETIEATKYVQHPINNNYKTQKRVTLKLNAHIHGFKSDFLFLIS